MIQEQVLMKLIQEHYLSRNSPTLKFQQDKVFTLGTITIPTEFKNYKNLKWLHLSIRQSTLGCTYPIGYIKTHQTKFSQSIILNPNQWQNAKDLKNSVRFYNQTSFIIDRKTKKKVATLN
jgi:hypothetical protein